MNITELFQLIIQKAEREGLDHFPLIKALRMSAHTYTDLKNNKFLTGFDSMSNRQKRQKYNIVAKLAVFVEMDPELVLKEVFPQISIFECNQACIRGKDLMEDPNEGSNTTLTEEDLGCLRQLIGNSTVPVTFQSAFDFLCKFRSRQTSV